MKAKKLKEVIEQYLEKAKAEGVSEIKIERFEKYLSELDDLIDQTNEEDALQTQRDIAWYTAKEERKLKIYDARISRINAGLGAVITIGQGALKSAAIINGGASIAILAFIGNLYSSSVNVFLVSNLADGLAIFGLGVFFAAAASGATYLAQEGYENSKRKQATIFQNTAICAVVISYLLFLFGGYYVHSAITATNEKQVELQPVATKAESPEKQCSAAAQKEVQPDGVDND